jgi:hypothetical protein
MSTAAASKNALATETSPYLQQHADNPVDWYPWGEEALAKARAEDKPILLSIGYSACHWCHVMAHESFEDPETAEVMNALFVNIKVDREERPDLDKIYQLAHQMLAQRTGGWPLTMFLTPDDHTPFFGGTYFPKEPRFGMPSFKDLLKRVAELYRERIDDIRAQNRSVQEAFAGLDRSDFTRVEAIDGGPLEQARQQLARAFDPAYGGFGEAPKFPHATNIERLLRHWAATRDGGRADDEALAMAVETLEKMALGGIYDQLGGGFCRYSTDKQWMIPHFEKMLYDNGPLLQLAAEAWLATGKPVFAHVARETAEWIMREMQSPEGGYYSTLDADSEGEEGKFYVWERDELHRLLEPKTYAVVARRYGVDREPNFEGRWHLHVRADLDTIARELGMEPAEAERRLAEGRRVLFEARENRVRPGRDEKVLTSWNGLMIKGMAVAGRILGEPAWMESAERALDFVRETMWRDGRLLATYKDGRAHLNAYLDDYAFLMDGILALLEARWRDGDLRFCVELAEVLLAAYEDREGGGFFFTADDHEALLHRPKPFADESVPAGNGVAAFALGRLGHLLGESRYLDAVDRTLRAAWPAVTGLPYAHDSLLNAAEEHLYPPTTVVLRGAAPELEALRGAAAGYAPRRMVLAIPEDARDLPGVLAARAPSPEGPVAYLCEGVQCGPPIVGAEAIRRALG